jgi:hypothetical protein
MMITLSRLYRDGVEARAVVDELKATGLPEGDIGIIAPSQSRLRERDSRSHTANRSAGVGAALGGAAELLPDWAPLSCQASARWWRRMAGQRACCRRGGGRCGRRRGQGR